LNVIISHEYLLPFADSISDQRIVQIRLNELEEDNLYQSLRQKIIEQNDAHAPGTTTTISTSTTTPINYEDYDLDLKYHGSTTIVDWWPTIDSVADFEDAINDVCDKKVMMIVANVTNKRSAATTVSTVPVTPPPGPASAPWQSTSTTAAAAVVSSSSSASKSKPIKRKSNAKRSIALSAAGAGKKRSVEERIMVAMAQLNALRITQPPRVQVALFAGYSNTKSAGFAKALSALSSQKWLEYPSSKDVQLTDLGCAQVQNVTDVPKTTSEVHDRLKLLMTPNGVRLFNVLSDGRSHGRTSVAWALKYTNEKSAGFAKALTTLSSLGILHYPKDPNDTKAKLVALTDIAFPFGRGDVGSVRAAGTNNAVFANPSASLQFEDDADDTSTDPWGKVGGAFV
jgi:hypothetical protein